MLPILHTVDKKLLLS